MADFPLYIPRKTLIKSRLGSKLIKEAPLARGLVGYWPMNERAGNVVNDLSGHYSLVWNGTSSSWVVGTVGTAIRFPGTETDYLSINSAVRTTADPFTVICVARRSDGGTDLKGLFGIQGTASTDVVLAAYYNADYNGFGVSRNVSNAGWKGRGAGAALTQSDWHMFAVTCAGGDVYPALYVDGVSWGTDQAYDLLGWATNATHIGRGYQLEYSAGSDVALFQIYDRVLSPTEIAALYADPYMGFADTDLAMYVSGEEEPPATTRVQVIMMGSLIPLLLIFARFRRTEARLRQ